LTDMIRSRYGIGTSFLLLWLCASWSSAASPTSYTLSDFQWYVRHADGSKQRTELLSQLSRRQVLVGVLWSDASERGHKLRDVQAFLQQGSTPLPALRQVKAGPSGGHFATYVITTKDEQSLAGVAVLLNTLQNSDTFDYALPVLQLSRGPAAPFIEFTALFSSAIETQTITTFLQRQPVTVLSQNGTAYTLRLNRRVDTNILAVIRSFEEASRLVEEVQPIWLDASVSQPVALSGPVPHASPEATAPSPSPVIEARTTLDTGWDLPLVDIRQPVTYRLQIEHSPQTLILPESIDASALRRALARETTLPLELFDITEASKQTEPLSEARTRTRVDYLLRVSKPGTYRIPALQIAYSEQDSRRVVQQIQSSPQQGYLLTVDAHLPVDTRALPGDILVSPRLRQPLWSWLRHLAFGMLAAGLLLLVLGLGFRTPRRRAVKPKPLSRRQIRQHYQGVLQQLQERNPIPSEPLSSEARSWLRDCATLLRRLLGEWAVGEPTLFEGGAGASKSMITAYLGSDMWEQTEFLEPALQLLQELDLLATAPASLLSPDDVQRLTEALQQIVLLLTNQEASRVFRVSSGL
jgi:hypothetical protein